MNPQKEFKIASIVIIALGVLDVLSIALGATGNGVIFGSLTSGGRVLIGALIAVMGIIALAKIYMGVMGLKYCKGTGKGKLHILLAKIGMVFSVLALVMSVVDLIGGAGTQDIIGEISSVCFIYWYLKLAEKNCD